jgi:L-ascorbate metabolism protein UlaG (beta-lactamase superfamily)
VTTSKSDHCKGVRFRNLGGKDAQPRGFFHLLRWMSNRTIGPWRDFVDSPPQPNPPPQVAAGDLRVTVINHSTTLVQTDGFNILTDPIWAKRAGPGGRIGPRRHHAPGLRIEQLPPIHILIVSHNHYDHLCLPTLRRLLELHQPLVITGLRNGTTLRKAGIRTCQELDWWDSMPIARDLRVTAVPAQHFSGRTLWDRDRALWSGYVVESRAGRVYFAGDTGFGPHLRDIGQRFAPIRLALLPIGAYKPRWFMQPVHFSPEDAVQAQALVGAETAVAIHFGTFALADDSETDPVEELERALAQRHPRPRFWALQFGEGRDVPALSATSTVSSAPPARN